MRYNWYLMMLLAVALLGAVPASAKESRFFGGAELKYLDYQSRSQATGDEYSAESFSQRYALAYSATSRNFMARPKPFEYDFIVGYEWLALDTKIQDNDFSQAPSFRTGRLFYMGELNYDPTTVPLSITAFSRDLQRTVVNNTTTSPLRSVFQTNIPISLLATGTHIDSGLTLTFGEKSGVSSRYGKLFTHIPMIMVDYTESINKSDAAADARTDNKTRRLAFVSLNKKENWFHYRTTTFDDYVDTNNNWQRSEVQIGTVDQRMIRHWVDLTNWITVSADGQFTKYRSNMPTGDYDDYNLNLFAIAARKSWQFKTFTTFNRRNEDGLITAERKIPVSLSGVWGADTDWSGNLYFRDLRNNNYATSEETRSITLQGTTFKRSSFTLSPMVGVRYSSAPTNKYVDLEGGAYVNSTRRFSSEHSLGVEYRVNAHLESKDVASGGLDYVAQKINARWSFQPFDRMRLQLQQMTELSNGLNGTGNSSVNFIRSRTMGSLSWLPSARLSASLNLANEFTRNSGLPLVSRQTVNAAAEYKSEVLRSNLTATYERESLENKDVSDKFNLASMMEYSPVRYYSSTLRARYELLQLNGIDAGSSYDVNLKSRYDYYPAAYVGRPLLQLEKEFSLVQESNRDPVSSIRLLARYNPLSRVSLNGSTTINVLGGAQQVYSLGANLNMKYFQTAVDYTYGRRSSDQRVDKRLAATVRREF